MIRDFERWPKYKENYIRAFQRMIDNHPGQIRILDPNAETKFKLNIPENSGGDIMFRFFIQNCNGNSRKMEESGAVLNTFTTIG